MRNQTLVVDIDKETCRVLKYKQYDNNNLLQIIVEKDDERVSLNGYTGYAFFKLPSGLVIKKDCSVQGSEVTINIDNNVLSESGKIALDLTLSDGNKTFTLFRINLFIEESIDKNGAIIVEAGWDIVSEIAKINKKIDNLDGADEGGVDEGALDELNSKINDVTSQLEHTANELNSKIDEVANNGVSTEVLEQAIKDEIDRQIQDGTIGNLTIEDNSISIEKLDNNLKNKLDKIDNLGGIDEEVLESVVKEEIDRQIQDGTIGNLTIEDNSISIEKLDNNLKNKLDKNSYSSWLAIGDSITVGYGNNNYSYADILSKKYNIYLTKDAVTGSSMASDSTKFGEGFANRVDNNGNDYNLITVMGGLNDFSHCNVTLGAFNPDVAITDEIDSFYTGVTILCKKLIIKYPRSKIVFLSSNRDNTYNNKNGESYEQYMQALKTVCSYFSIPFYRIDDLCGYNRDVYVNQSIDCGDLNTDDIHPVTQGHMKIAGAISNCINFINPVDSWGNGTLSITKLNSTIPLDATISKIRESLNIKVIYENGLEVEINEYSIIGNVTEGESTFIIDYRGIRDTVTFVTSESSGGIIPSYQMEGIYTVNNAGDKTFDTEQIVFSTQSAKTIRIAGVVNSYTTTNGFPVLSSANPSALVQFSGFNLMVNIAGYYGIASNSGSNLMIANSLGSNLKYSDGAFDFFITYDGDKTLKVYNIKNSQIDKISQNTNFSITRFEDWTLKLFPSASNDTNNVDATIETLKVYDVAFTEDDVLRYI